MKSKVVFGALLYRTKQVACFKSLGMQRNVGHSYLTLIFIGKGP